MSIVTGRSLASALRNVQCGVKRMAISHHKNTAAQTTCSARSPGCIGASFKNKSDYLAACQQLNCLSTAES